MSNRTEIRRRAERTLAWVAVMTQTSPPTVRLFELDPEAVKSHGKRARLDELYARMAKEQSRDT